MIVLCITLRLSLHILAHTQSGLLYQYNDHHHHHHHHNLSTHRPLSLVHCIINYIQLNRKRVQLYNHMYPSVNFNQPITNCFLYKKTQTWTAWLAQEDPAQCLRRWWFGTAYDVGDWLHPLQCAGKSWGKKMVKWYVKQASEQEWSMVLEEFETKLLHKSSQYC